jgi:hypothetical protein
MADEKQYIDAQPEEDASAEPGGELEVHEAQQPPAEYLEEPHAQAGEAPPVAGRWHDESSPKKWYIIHTYSGFENKVQECCEPALTLSASPADRADPDSHRRSSGVA